MTASTTGASSIAGSLALTRAGFAVATVAAIFMTVTEGLGTGIVPFWTRLIYWLIVMETGALIGAAVTAGVQHCGGLRRQPVIEVAAIGVLIALPLTLTVIGTGIVLLSMEAPRSASVVRIFGLVVFVSAIITGITYAIGARDRPGQIIPTAVADAEPARAPSSDAESSAASGMGLRTRLPQHLQQAPIVALVSEDHYLRVRCDGGDALILMRLSDAIAALGDAEGAQTHRSWWVARDAVVRAQRGEGKGILVLVDGSEAPVSRTHYRRLVSEGWFG